MFLQIVMTITVTAITIFRNGTQDGTQGVPQSVIEVELGKLRLKKHK